MEDLPALLELERLRDDEGPHIDVELGEGAEPVDPLIWLAKRK